MKLPYSHSSFVWYMDFVLNPFCKYHSPYDIELESDLIEHGTQILEGRLGEILEVEK